jgi:hypothetical protein
MIDTLLLLALPASGKSEVRRYLEHLDPIAVSSDMRLGPTVQLDDYPYVHTMRRISQELNDLGEDPVFFVDDQSAWNDPHDWLTLTHLLNEDFAGLRTDTDRNPNAGALLDRFDRARRSAGTTAPFESMDPSARSALEAGIATEAAMIASAVPTDRPDGSTVVIEFARGGPDGAQMPLPHPLGYRSSLGVLDDSLLERASILYVWVSPEESRRRNRERAHPGQDGDASILHHGVPEAVMYGEYGCDDMAWLEDRARRPGTIPIGEHDIPFARFDNRDDLTSFLRADPDEWDPRQVTRVHDALSGALTALDIA